MRDRDPIDQPCAMCGERITGDAADDHLHVIDVPAWDVRIGLLMRVDVTLTERSARAAPSADLAPSRAPR